MKLKNPFSDSTRYLFFETRYECWLCGSNDSCELHHIAGRISDSPLNGSVLCHHCHSQVTHSEEEEKDLFAKNLRYLMKNKYEINEKDMSFISSYKRLFEVIHII